MKMILKLIVIMVVLNGAYRVAMDEYRFSQLKDSTNSILTLGTKTPVEELKDMVLKKAADLELPVSPEHVSISREGVRTTAAVEYSSAPELFPGYKYPRDHKFTDEIVALR